MDKQFAYLGSLLIALNHLPAHALPATAPAARSQTESPRGVEASARSLAEQLRQVERVSGVRFKISPTVAADRVQVRPHAAAWPDVIREMLRGYNYLATHDDSGRLAEVTVTGRNGDGSAPPPENGVPASGDPLLSYRPGPKAKPARFRSHAANSVYRIDVPADRLRKMKKGTRVTVDLPTGRYQLVHDNAWRHENGDTTWAGYLDGQSGHYRAMLTLSESGAVVGRILTPEGLYELEPAEHQNWLVDIEASGLERASLEGDEATWQPGLYGGSAGFAAVPSSHGATDRKTGMAANRIYDHTAVARPSRATLTSEGWPVIDLLVLYTRTMASDDLMTRLNNLVALTNQAFVDSQIKAVVRLVGARPVKYPSSNLNSAALDDLTANFRDFAKVPRLRRNTGADAVILIRAFRPFSQGGNCGIAWVNGSDGTILSADQAYGVVSYGESNGYFCSDYTFAHELGHAMGATHDRQHTDIGGVFPYSHGYGIRNRFGDIMSYDGPELGLYSNPDISVCDGLPCGIPIDQPDSANVALTFNKTAKMVSAFIKAAKKNRIAEDAGKTSSLK